MNKDYEFEFFEEEKTTFDNPIIPKKHGLPKGKNGIFLRGTEKFEYHANGKIFTFPLREVTREELSKIRRTPDLIEKLESKKAGIAILKRFDKYYIATIPSKLSFISQVISVHLCMECQRCYASSDENGGCAKVRDLSLNSYLKKEISYTEALKKSRRIEKYSFIKFGIETINTSQDAFLVFECDNFNKEPEKKEYKTDKLSGLELVKTKYELSQWVHPLTSWEHFRLMHRKDEYGSQRIPVEPSRTLQFYYPPARVTGIHPDLKKK